MFRVVVLMIAGGIVILAGIVVAFGSILDVWWDIPVGIGVAWGGFRVLDVARSRVKEVRESGDDAGGA